MILECSKCKQKNRVAGFKGRQRCAKCKQEFTEAQLMMATIGDTLAPGGVERVQWEDGTGFDIPKEKK